MIYKCVMQYKWERVCAGTGGKEGEREGGGGERDGY